MRSKFNESTPMTYPDAVLGQLHDYQCTCCIRSLPRSIWQIAAKSAVAANPSNAPAAHLYVPHEQELTIPPEFIAVLTNKYWGRTGVLLTVGFLDSPASDFKTKVLSHMNAWGESANVKFVESNSSPQVRIAREATGYWSYLGTDILHVAPGAPTMNLQGFTMSTPDSEFFRVVRHETGHTLGFPHEHMRQEIVGRINRQRAIQYFMQTEGWTEAQVIRNVLTPLDNSALIATSQADPTSIMCYWLPGSIMEDGVSVPGGPNINQQDQEFAASMYPIPRQRALAMAPFGSGIFTALEAGSIYFSPDGEAPGGGGSTKLVYGPGQRVCAMTAYAGGVLTAFDGGGVYLSRDGDNLGGGGSTERVYGPGQRVVAMTTFKGGIVTAFDGGGVYFSPDGKNVGGGGASSLIYGPDGQRVLAMAEYQGGLLVAFSEGGIYFSPDGQHLAGGGATQLVYNGGQRVCAMTNYRGGVLTAFDGGAIYFSPDGKSLGGGGATSVVYSAGQRTAVMIQFAGGVMTAFEGKGIYYSPTGTNLGGGGSTHRVY